MAQPAVEIQFSKRQLRAVRRLLRGVPRGLQRAVPAAINKTAQTARTRLVRRIREHSQIKAKDARKQMTLKRANRLHWSATIRLSGKRIPLIRFGARHGKRGVTYRIGRGGKRRRLAHAFEATMPSGHTGIFRRVAESRLPIIELFGPSLWGVYVVGGIDRETETDIAGILNKNLESQVQRLLAGK